MPTPDRPPLEWLIDLIKHGQLKFTGVVINDDLARQVADKVQMGCIYWIHDDVYEFRERVAESPKYVPPFSRRRKRNDLVIIRSNVPRI